MRMTRRTILLALLLLALPYRGAIAAPRAELWAKWLTHDPTPRKAIDHTSWAQFLRHYVQVGHDGINRVTYASVSRDDREKLDPTWTG